MKLATMTGLVILLAFGLLPVRAGEPVSAEAGFARIREIAASTDSRLRETILPSSLVERRRGWGADDIERWRAGFCRRLARTKRFVVSEAAGHAVVRIPDRGGDVALLLRRDADRWIVDCAEPYLVSGRKLRATRGRRPARVVLAKYDEGVDWKGCAVSFGHVTQDPEKCKNIMDLHYCRCGRLHASRGGSIAWADAKPLDAIEGLRADWNPVRGLAPEKGSTYAIHCRRTGRWDFWVKARIVEIGRRSVTLEWELLAIGPGAPASIHRAVPIPYPGDGSDGRPGLCGRGRPYRPEDTPRRRGGTTTGK